MTMVLREDFLRELLRTRLVQANSFPVSLNPSRPCVQIIQVMLYSMCVMLIDPQFPSLRDGRDLEGFIEGVISDSGTCIRTRFSSNCCNLFQECPPSYIHINNRTVGRR